jgi:tripartite ATP-independent transporter DctM subunit
MSEITIGLMGLGFLIALFATGLELAFAMLVVGFLGFAYIVSPGAALNLLAKDIFESFESYSLTVVPLFILMGQLAFHAGIARRLYDTANKFIGHVAGGLGIATVAGCTVFGAICGSATATAATFAAVSIPEMDRFGYSRKFSAGLVAIAGTLGIMIPPSVPMIIYGILTQQSIGKLFVAGIVPGVVAALLFIFLIVGRCKINPLIAPRGERFGWKRVLNRFRGVIWPSPFSFSLQEDFEGGSRRQRGSWHVCDPPSVLAKGTSA